MATIPIHPDKLDADPWQFNCPNGILDLRKGTLRDHRREDFITKASQVSFDPAAKCPQFLGFLDSIMAKNQSLIPFLQRAIGYALTGDIAEQCFFIFYGHGANGKSTLLEVLRSLVGDYGQQASFTTFLSSDQERVRNDLARLRGARLVTAVEVEEGRRLSEVVVKQVTGGDPITARFLYSENFEFKPQFKLFLACNHKPVIRGTDHAIWRRIRLIPFTVEIPDDQQDKELPLKLRAELPGILTWAVKGCLDWQRDGLAAPKEVLHATKEYREEMDVLGMFLDECCDTQGEVLTGHLFGAYKNWAEAQEEYVMSQKLFALKLRERGFTPYARHGNRYWREISLKSGVAPEF